MADSVPKLRRLLNEARERIRQLESMPRPEPIVEIREVVSRVEVEKVVYVDNPEHIMTIKILQDRLCQYTSASDS